MKYLKYILIICPIILSLLLGINIYKYIISKQEYKNIIETTNNYENKIKDNNSKKENLNNELSSLKEEKKSKIEEYEKWVKWTKDINEKIN